MNDKALSPVLGFVLVFAIIIAGIGMVQTLFVPAWMKSEEAKHYFKLKEEFEKLDDKIIEAGNFKYSSLDLPTTLRYSKYPFLMTPNVVSSEVWVEEIGKIRIFVNGSSEPVELPLKLIGLRPNYLYSQMNPEVFVLGCYFSLGEKASLIEPFEIVSDNSAYILVSDLEKAGEQMRFYGNHRAYEEANWVNISLYPEKLDKYGGLLEELKKLLDELNVTSSVGNNFLNFSTKDKVVHLYTASDSEVRLNDLIKQSAVGDGDRFKITLGNSSHDFYTYNETGQQLNYNETFTVSKSNNQEWLAGGTLYITGYTPYSNSIMNVTIEYVYCASPDNNKNDKESCDVDEFDRVTVNTPWRTFSDGYFQFPVTVALAYRVKGGADTQFGMPYWINVTIEDPNGGKTVIPIFIGEEIQPKSGSNSSSSNEEESKKKKSTYND
ncbi:hypothetical protein Ferp_1535 [Ferroglobus placidus DSM 10642]|uniref:Uncharacterized protein n=1 Tax=Ferroglobus placidus (strain DSM 10642 / AEDII12DO) TaxID=589924 RepID=D3RYX3_FERPA|nr:hypothetical protein [Ferroglobus placidus]ADC65686.1 hypothetical protein Ferp_1535 [Ferroglobus placidus DSM 10642]